jgi:cobalamin biosynthesis protein CobC
MSDATPFHGGDLADVAGEPGSETGWLDLSTGINPIPFPLPQIDPAIWARLPGRRESARLIGKAVACYGAPASDVIVAAPGSQAAIQSLPTLFESQNVAVVSPTYAEHAAAWRAAGHTVREIGTLDASGPGEIAIAVNPNNPDGRTLPPERLAEDAARRSEAGGLLVVDEAFADTAPGLSMIGACATHRVVILRSFGKFFGLAGLRLGFAAAPPDIASRLRARMGPWATSGPAIEIATRALGDTDWQTATRRRLERDTERLRRLLAGGGLDILGGTNLFTLVSSDRAPALYDHLLANRIYVRRFPQTAHWLRFGLPGTEDGFSRLERALTDFRP